MTTTVVEIKSELRTAIANGETLEELRDNSHEWINGFLPVYNNRIIDEWKNMPSEYDNRGWAELGYEGDADIIRLMSLDLYLYYSDKFEEAISDLEEELEEAGE